MEAHARLDFRRRSVAASQEGHERFSPRRSAPWPRCGDPNSIDCRRDSSLSRRSWVAATRRCRQVDFRTPAWESFRHSPSPTCALARGYGQPAIRGSHLEFRLCVVVGHEDCGAVHAPWKAGQGIQQQSGIQILVRHSSRACPIRFRLFAESFVSHKLLKRTSVERCGQIGDDQKRGARSREPESR